MTDRSLARAIDALRRCHPRARYFEVAEVPTPAPAADGDPGLAPLHHASLYEHAITNSFEPVRGHLFMVSNGFVTSYVYNLALVWLWYGQGGEALRPQLDAALRHNFKKFFAECTLARANCLVARGLLIETLTFEQDLMRPIFEAAQKDPALKKTADEIAHLMTSLLTFHEFGHYALQQAPALAAAHVEGLFGGALKALLGRLATPGEHALGEEIVCDALAAHQIVHGDDDKLRDHDALARGRMAAFHHLVFPILASLQRSAHATAEACAAEDAIVDLTSEKRPKHPFTFRQGRDEDAFFRGDRMVELLAADAASCRASLFGDDGAFVLPTSSREVLRHAFERFGDEIEPFDGRLTGTDRHRRGLGQLLAEALHGHDEGSEFLLWRSKRFSVGGQPVDR